MVIVPRLFKSTLTNPCLSTTGSSIFAATPLLPLSMGSWRATCIATVTSAPHQSSSTFRTCTQGTSTWLMTPFSKIAKTTAALRAVTSCLSMISRDTWTRSTQAKMSCSCETYSLRWSDSLLTLFEQLDPELILDESTIVLKFSVTILWLMRISKCFWSKPILILVSRYARHF